MLIQQTITNASSTDALELPPVLGGAEIAASGSESNVIDTDNVTEEYLEALQDLVDAGDATVTFAQTAFEENDVLGAFNKAMSQQALQERAGTQAFAASTSESVSLSQDMPDTDYVVLTEMSADPSDAQGPWITNKAVDGFDIEFDAAVTMDVTWVVKAI